MPESQVIASREEARFFPFAGLFHFVRHSFWTAGQDSYSFPPAQNPDMFAQLTNVEPIMEGNILRRRGYSLFNAGQNNLYTRAGIFRSLRLQKRYIIFGGNPPGSVGFVQAYFENGSLGPLLFNPSNGALSPRMFNSRDYEYFADGSKADQFKWDGTDNGAGNAILTNWGIDINAAATTTGPDAPTVVSQSGSGTAWANPTNIEVADGLFATVSLSGGIPQSVSQLLKATSFGFSVAAGTTITGIQVNIKGLQNAGQLQVQLVTSVGATGQTRNLVLPATNGTVSVGGATDLWGINPAPSDANATSFGVQIQGLGVVFQEPTAPTSNISIDFVSITIYLGAPALTLGTPSAGSVTLTIGRRYTYCLLNANTGGTSSIAKFTPLTVALSSQQQPLSGIPTIITDSQVTHILLLATPDGGDEASLFLLAQIGVGTSTYTDNTTEVILEGSAVYQETDIFGVNHGVIDNNPPPALQVATTHRGRVFGIGAGSNAPFLFFSKNLNEVLTSTGTLTGHWEEEWPATFQLPIGKEFQTGRGLLSDGQVLYIGTERSILRLIGDSPQNFNVPEVVFNETGILSQETWQMVFLEDQPIGTMWLTPDFRVMLSDFNTYRDVGLPIQDVLNSINVAATIPPWSVYVNHGAFDLWMLWIPTGTNTTPDTCCVYNLKNTKWFIWKPTDSGTTGIFNIDISGTPQWLFAVNAATKAIYQWELDGTTFQDRINNTPVSYPVTVQTSFLNFGDLTLKKVLQQIIAYSGDTALTVAVDGAQTEAQFITPVSVKAATTLAADPFGNQFVPLAGVVSKWHWYRFTFTSPAGTTKQVLSGYDVEAFPVHRL